METVRVQLSFEEDTPHGKFKSALYFTEDEWKKIKPEEIKTKKQKHVDTFVAIIETPRQEPTQKEIEYELQILAEQEAYLRARREELEAQQN